ncbi:RNA polymerase [Bacteriophage DSS3_PM1]|nr:RNA polymerase [Bacteriophage DSS3_PM1]
MDAEKVLSELTVDLTYRMDKLDARGGAYWIKQAELDPRFLIEFSYSHVLRALERRGTLVEVSSSIGRRLKQKLKLKQNSVEEIHGGWFILISFVDMGLISYTKEKTKKNDTRTSKHRSFVLFAQDWDRLKILMDTIDNDHCDMFPVKVRPAQWEPGYPYHSTTGTPIVKKGSKMQLDPFKEPVPEMNILFDTLNKLSSTGWRINRPVFEAYKFFQDNLDKFDKSPFKLKKEQDQKKKKSMVVEMEAIRRLADKNLDHAFYHLYNFDFRGRIYPNTAFLHEQSSDNAKGILTLDEKVPLGKDGMKWLYFHATNSWGEDKLELPDRVQWAKDHLSMIWACAEDPYSNQEWLEAEKAFSFLACCIEIKAALEFAQDHPVSEFESGLPIYIDGTNNGVQHLAAMSQDEEVAPLVNLVPQKKPGDVYMFIADKAWGSIEGMCSELPQKILKKFEETFEEGKRLQQIYADAPPKSERKALAYADLKHWKHTKRKLREQLFPVYWAGVTDPKIRRKTVKRNTMTLGYGGTEYGMGQQVIEDTRQLSDYLRDKDYLWGIMMGELVYNTCYAELKGPAAMLRMFEALADRSNGKSEPLSWRSPLTRFPVVQDYRKAKSVRLKLKHNDRTLWTQIQVWEEATLNESKQRTGAAPNIVHSLDAVHLTITVYYADYPMVVVHDSFGCHAGNMEKLFRHVRQTFVDLYAANPLEDILGQLDSEDLMPEKGNLDVSEILSSDFAFS